MEIAMDLDGTLASYEGWRGIDHIGDPIPKMVDILMKHIEIGDNVTIFTSRVAGNDREESNDSRHNISKWLRKNNLPQLEITATKEKKFRLFYDDRGCSVLKNMGLISTIEFCREDYEVKE